MAEGIWRCPFTADFPYVEAKKNGVVAQGWTELGDMANLKGLSRSDFEPNLKGMFVPIWGEEEYTGDKELGLYNLLNSIRPGNLIVASEGTKAVGICEACKFSRYFFDDSLEWGHCFGLVEWVNISDVEQELKQEVGTLAVPKAGIKGIDGHQYWRDLWEKYKERTNFEPCGKELRNMSQNRQNKEKYDRYKKALLQFGQIIFHGPPGTGKTFEAEQLAASLLKVDADSDDFKKEHFFQLKEDGDPIKSYSDGAWAIVQFHPSYNYEDFVRGIQAQGNGATMEYPVVNRLFAALCIEALKYEKVNKNFVLIIDEMNRANVAAVLGELIYALEYRGTPISTPYALKGDNTLTVPKNLYIIGTMNTADRSIGHIDYAIRRRFAFEKMLPERDVLDDYYDNNKKTLECAKKLFKTVQTLFFKDGENRGERSEWITPEYDPEDVAVGHTYFMAKNKDDEKELEMKWRYQVVPLLEEYVKDGILKEQARERFLKTPSISFFKEHHGSVEDEEEPHNTELEA